YAPGSTTVNDLPLLDFAGSSPLLVQSGLTLGDVGAGVEVIARLRMIVNTPIPAGTLVETRAYVNWDEQPEIVVGAAPLRVRASAALPIVDPTLPFAVLDAAAGRPEMLARGPRQGAIAGETYIQLPPAVPVRSNGANGERAQLPPAPESAPVEEAQVETGAATFLDLDDERLEWTVQYLEEARFPGLLGHLMVVRALFPQVAIADDATVALELHGDALGEIVDRLFLKLRMPEALLDRDDLETTEARASLRAVIDALRHSPAHGRPDRDGLWLEGFVDRGELGEAAKVLGRAKLVTAAPWRVLATLMGTSLRRGGVEVADFSDYRDALVDAFTDLGRLSPAEFADALRKPTEVELETQREAVVEALAGERRATV
ncbi:MAG TPA: hypothetical protein VGN14_00080, partial [Candidatus Elarobacter sp.]